MAINPRVLAVGGGAALGAYTSDITDNPLTGLLSTGIAAGVGSLLVLPKSNLQDRLNVSHGAKINSDEVFARSSAGESIEENKIKTSFRNKTAQVEGLVSKINSSKSLSADEKEILEAYKTNMNSVKYMLRQQGINIKNDFSQNPKAFMEELGTISDDKIMKRVLPLFSEEVKEVVNMTSLGDPRVQDIRHVISHAEDETAKVKKLADIFTKQMGNSVEEANKKAAMIVARSVGDIKIVNGTAEFIDKADNKGISLPLTSYDQNGVRYHNAGNGNAYSVKGFTPYLELATRQMSYTKDGSVFTPTFDQVRSGMSPEMMLDFLDKNKPISSLLSDIKSHISYNSDSVSPEFYQKGFTASSPTFINESSTIKTDKILNLDHNGQVNAERPFRSVRLTANKLGQKSEQAVLRSMFTEHVPRASELIAGTSNNSITDLQSRSSDTLGLFTPRERNLTGSGIRDTLPVKETYGTKAVHEVMRTKGGDINYASSQVVEKLSIINQKAFNNLSVDLLGDNSSILADGYGMYNMGKEQDFSVKKMKDLKIPLGPTTIISNKALSEAIKSGNVDAWIKENGAINVGTDVIGYTPTGEAVGLKSHFSDGSITSAFINSKNELVLRAEGRFNPNSEGELKYHSIGSKVLARGVREKQFNLLATAGQLMNQGAISYKDGQVINTGVLSGLKAFMGDAISLDEFRALANNDDFLNTFGSKNISLITSAKHDGMEKLHEVLSRPLTEVASSAFAEESGAKFGLNVKGVRPRDALIAGFLTLETKAAEDLSAHLANNLLSPLLRAKDNTATNLDYARIAKFQEIGLIKDRVFRGTGQEQIDDAIARVTNAFRTYTDKTNFFGDKKKKAMERLTKLVSISGMAEDIVAGKSTAIGTAALGGSIVGANNSARMSWNAYFNLRKTGYTREQLGKFGKVDENLIYELQGVLNETKTSSGVAINDAIKGRERVAESLLESFKPEDRLSAFRTEFSDIDVKNPYIKYRLNHTGSHIKELNFSLLSTARSGKFSVEDREILKTLDKHRLNIMSLDIDYASASDARGKKIAKDRLETALKEYEQMNKKIMKGDLIKSSISLYSDSSAIKIANPIGGQAQEFIEGIERDANGKYKAIANYGFMSENSVEDVAKRLNISTNDIIYQDVESNGKSFNLKKAGYMDGGKFVPFTYMMTREPAQGDLSSHLLEIIMDPTIKGKKSSIHLVEGQYAYTVGMLGDFDQDTLQNLYARLSRVEYESMSEVGNALRASHEPYLDIEKNMSPKALEKKSRSLTSFDSLAEYEQYVMDSDMKGKVRKVYAPMATKMAMNYTAAIDLAYGDDLDKKTLGRLSAYRLVENLIKTSHVDTATFGGDPLPIDQLNIARENYLKTGREADYKAIMEKHLPTALGKGALGFDSEEAKKLNTTVDNATQLIMEAELRKAKTVSALPQHVLSINGASSLSDMHRQAEEVMASLDMFDVEKGVDIKRSPQQLYRGLNDAIVDTIKGNKGLLIGGAAALVGVNLLGRSEPSFSDSREAMKMHSNDMIHTPRREIENGINTNTVKTAYIQPENYSKSRSVNVQGDFVDSGYQIYNQFNSMLDSEGPESQMQNLNSALFGGGLRSARLDITDL